MTARVVAVACAVSWPARARGRRPRCWLRRLSPLLRGQRALVDARARGRRGPRVVSVSGRRQTMAEHLARGRCPACTSRWAGCSAPTCPLVADDPDHVVRAPRAGRPRPRSSSMAPALILAARRRAARAAAWPAARAAGRWPCCVFPLPAALGPGDHPLPHAALPAPGRPAGLGAPWRAASARRAWIVVLALAALHLAGARGLLAAWRGADRAAAPFLLPDLAPVLRARSRPTASAARTRPTARPTA